MPVSLEQWRASVGNNNAARSSVLRKRAGKKSPKGLIDQFFTFLLVLFSSGAGLATNNRKMDILSELSQHIIIL